MYLEYVTKDDGYNSWVDSREADILEQYILSIEDDYDETPEGREYLAKLTFEDVPDDFKNEMFESWESNGGDDCEDDYYEDR